MICASLLMVLPFALGVPAPAGWKSPCSLARCPGTMVMASDAPHHYQWTPCPLTGPGATHVRITMYAMPPLWVFVCRAPTLPFCVLSVMPSSAAVAGWCLGTPSTLISVQCCSGGSGDYRRWLCAAQQPHPCFPAWGSSSSPAGLPPPQNCPLTAAPLLMCFWPPS